MEVLYKSREDMIREERNRAARQWRANNKEKNKVNQDRYWFNRAKKRMDEELNIKEGARC